MAGEKLRTTSSHGKLAPAIYYLGAAVYAHHFPFGEGGASSRTFDRRYRAACDLYNYGGSGVGRSGRYQRGRAFGAGRRRLPVGKSSCISVRRIFPALDQFDQFLAADKPRCAASVSAIGHPGWAAIDRRATWIPNCAIGEQPATVFLRVTNTLAEVASGQAAAAALELYYPFNQTQITVGRPAGETDITARVLTSRTNPFVWRLQRLRSFSPELGLRSQVLMSHAMRPGRVPVVFVHGTFSSPICGRKWSTPLNADRFCERCQNLVVSVSQQQSGDAFRLRAAGRTDSNGAKRIRLEKTPLFSRWSLSAIAKVGC